MLHLRYLSFHHMARLVHRSSSFNGKAELSYLQHLYRYLYCKLKVLHFIFVLILESNFSFLSLLQWFLIYCFQISSFPSQTKTLPCSLVRCIFILFYSIFQFYNQYQLFYKRIKKKIHHRLVIHYKHDSLLPLYTIVF